MAGQYVTQAMRLVGGMSRTAAIYADMAGGKQGREIIAITNKQIITACREAIRYLERVIGLLSTGEEEDEGPSNDY